MIEITSASEAQAFINGNDTFLFDCDGVIWLGYQTPIPGSVEALQYLHSLGKRVIFVSNNSLHSRRDFVDIFHSFGLTHVSIDDIFTSTSAAAQYITHISPIHNNIFVLGGPGIVEELELTNLRIFYINEDGTNYDARPEKVDAVIVGLDSKLSYDKLALANTYLRHVNDTSGAYEAEFITTNMDNILVMKDGSLPGTGSISSFLIYSSGRIPTIIGKPSIKLLDCITEKLHIDPKRTCMVGDRLDTDIVFGHKGGINTLLVFSGYSTRKELSETPTDKRPTFACQSIGDLVKFIAQ
ncbi:haloacid dehalogenase-like hydrolase [Mitosporidium daphniae]|uniref:4-nitrophenylphosphatase n=1 Tax=Mitosporidium daphniae TaxID=1485682 RepID=A0A098VMU8_9MICR|nr:haloacid dehalogenase-like hydrolase [Mitosporidium daphniae]KGG50372.1 haloacid dehalogenase-like hydrolase [Mitosporidium daphniae]|eukprot:XP_013236799.1 haloacid dehalogenase-like hydrolase [Mitosporidium daphniae]